eukprot:6435929-Amphidinium_carterae.1
MLLRNLLSTSIPRASCGVAERICSGGTFHKACRTLTHVALSVRITTMPGPCQAPRCPCGCRHTCTASPMETCGAHLLLRALNAAESLSFESSSNHARATT